MMMKVMMRKAQECAEQILGRDSPTPSTCKQLLPGNVLTPHNIPEFFLPPQLIRQHSDGPQLIRQHSDGPQLIRQHSDGPQLIRQHSDGPPMQTETGSPVRTQAHAQERGDIQGTALAAGGTKRGKERQPSQTQVLRRPAQLAVKPLDQGCLYESPHTRRKESLFHCTVSCLRLEPHSPAAAVLTHSHTRGAPGRAHTHASVARSSQASPLSHSALGESDAEVDTPSSAESTPQATPPTRRWSPSPSHLAPPLPFALELLHCQERLHREHLLLMPTRGRLRLATERPVPSPSYDQPPILRVRVVSVEGLHDAGELRPFSCGLSLCLTPGKLQQQHSATIRHCREPVVFNEDFYFSQPEGQALSRMELQIKVKDKSRGLGRVCVLGVISKPLSELMAL